MKVTKSTLEETRRIMAAQESEWSSTIRQEVETVEKLKHLCHSLNIDTSALKVYIKLYNQRIILSFAQMPTFSILRLFNNLKISDLESAA